MTPDTNDELATALGTLVTKTNPQAEVKNTSTAGRMLTLAQNYTVATAEDYNMAAEDLRRIMVQSSNMDEERKSFTGPLNAILDKFNARFMPHIKTLNQAATLLKGKMGTFTAEQERLARIEREKAEAEAAAERRRLAAEAEALRRKAEDEARAVREAEARRQAEARAEQQRLEALAASAKTAKARKEAAEQAEIKRMEDERLAEESRQEQARVQLEAEQRAQSVENTAAMVIAQPSTAVDITRAAGVSQRVTIDYEVTDPKLFLRWILDSRPDLIELVMFDGVKMRAFTKLSGLKTTAPGLRVFAKNSVAVR